MKDIITTIGKGFVESAHMWELLGLLLLIIGIGALMLVRPVLGYILCILCILTCMYVAGHNSI